MSCYGKKIVQLNYNEIESLVNLFNKYKDSNDYQFEIVQSNDSGIGLSTDVIVKNEYNEIIEKHDITDVLCW